jgi:hypothetical protein
MKTQNLKLLERCYIFVKGYNWGWGNKTFCSYNNKMDNFYQWFVGFAEGEACFKIKPKYRDGKSKVHSFSFEFEIHLHIDEKNLLDNICNSLGIGKVYTREKNSSCSYVVGNEKGIRTLLDIFDKYKINGIKYLDYVDFRKAFLIYFDRIGILTDEIRTEILKLHNSVNTSRTDFNMPLDHQVKITPYWLLGLIEAEGSFYLNRDPIRPGFQILLTAAQEPLLIKIKEYLENNLGFDLYSLWRIKNSSVISVNPKKAVGKSKPAVTFDIRDVRILHNYFLPYLDKLNFLSKKFQDFFDLKIICRTVYNGAHKNGIIKDLVIKLSLGMNDFRLSNYKGKIPKQVMTKEDINILENALPLSKHLPDGRVRDTATGNIDHNNESSVYLIINPNNEELIVKSLKEAGNIIGNHYTTLSKKLDVLSPDSTTEINNHSIRRIKVLYK